MREQEALDMDEGEGKDHFVCRSMEEARSKFEKISKYAPTIHMRVHNGVVLAMRDSHARQPLNPNPNPSHFLSSRSQDKAKEKMIKKLKRNAVKMFKKLDKDGDKVLSKDEIMTGHKLLRITELEASKLFDELDVPSCAKCEGSLPPSKFPDAKTAHKVCPLCGAQGNWFKEPDGHLTKDELLDGYMNSPNGFQNNKENKDVREKENTILVQEYLEGDNFEAKLPVQLRNNVCMLAPLRFALFHFAPLRVAIPQSCATHRPTQRPAPTP